jgi:EpsI family protein
MIGNTAVRLYIVAAIVPLTWWAAGRLNVALQAPTVDMPEWSFSEMPRSLGEWRGEDTEMDPKIANATGAQVIVNRAYRDSSAHMISMHTAIFDDPKGGVYHSPLTCYRSSGWEKLRETHVNLPINDASSIPVSVTLWRRQGERNRIVVYWYQLGKHVLFDRWDLGLRVRWSLAGKPTWPALIKVMMEIPVADDASEDDARAAILDFAELVAKWENQPSHRYAKGMLGPQEEAAGDKSTTPP